MTIHRRGKPSSRLRSLLVQGKPVATKLTLDHLTTMPSIAQNLRLLGGPVLLVGRAS